MTIAAHSATGARKRKATIDQLWGRLCNQGSVSLESAAAVPELVATATRANARDRDRVLELLVGIAVGDHVNFLDGALSPARRRSARVPKTKSVEQKCYEAVAAHAPAFRALLDDRDRRVRGASAFVLAWLTDPKGVSARAIAARLAKEKDEAARVAMLLSLGHLGAGRVVLSRAHETGGTSPTGVAAAIALTYLDGTKTPAPIRATLEAACVNRALEHTEQPWNGGDLAGHAAALLATFPARKRGDASARLEALGYMAGDKLAGQLVRKLFAGRERKLAETLTDPQRTLLCAIVRGGFLRPMGEVAHALGLRGLPPLRDLPAFVGVKPGIHRELRRRRR